MTGLNSIRQFRFSILFFLFSISSYYWSSLFFLSHSELSKIQLFSFSCTGTVTFSVSLCFPKRTMNNLMRVLKRSSLSLSLFTPPFFHHTSAYSLYFCFSFSGFHSHFPTHPHITFPPSRVRFITSTINSLLQKALQTDIPFSCRHS